MLDIKVIRENPEKINELLKRRNPELSVDSVLKIDEDRRKIQFELDNLRATRKTEIGKSGKITTSNGMEYYAHIFNLEVKEHDEYEEKTIFVNEELLPVAQSINNRIEKLLYEHESNGEEMVIVYYVTGANKVINVTCDSLKAISLDVLKEI